MTQICEVQRLRETQILNNNDMLRQDNALLQGKISDLEVNVRSLKYELQLQRQKVLGNIESHITQFESQSKMIFNEYQEECMTQEFGEGTVKVQRKRNSIQIQGDLQKSSKLINTLALDACKQISSQEKFRGIIIDYPWDDTGYIHPYKTMTLNQMKKVIDFESLQDYGLVFCWVSNNGDTPAINFMIEQGYQKIEIITWVKLKKNGAVANGLGYYLLHSTEQCIVFLKKHPTKPVETFMNRQLINNVILSCPEGPSSQKPFQLYEMIEEVLIEKSFLELFGRAHNQREGWVTIGDESIHYDQNYLKFAKEQRYILSMKRKLKESDKNQHIGDETKRLIFKQNKSRKKSGIIEQKPGNKVNKVNHCKEKQNIIRINLQM